MGDLWKNKKYPDGCRNCGQTAKRSVGFGLCYDCYTQEDILRAVQNESKNLDAKNETPPGVDGVEEIGLEPTEGVTTERRPGSFTSPVSDTDGVPGEPTEGEP